MKLFLELLAVCVGIISYDLVVHQDLTDTWIKLYWTLFGAGFVFIKYKVWNKGEGK